MLFSYFLLDYSVDLALTRAQPSLWFLLILSKLIFLCYVIFIQKGWPSLKAEISKGGSLIPIKLEKKVFSEM